MQICAIDTNGALIFAENANKYQDYQCIECFQNVRLRRGIHRKAHYYHTQPTRICRQHAKGMPHLMLQHFIKNILPEGEAEMECPFASIGRIADVAWHNKKLIYEIQCSPISKEEVERRNASYSSLGYQVVWIFHDKRYNQYRLSSAEHFLIGKPHYYSNMNDEGEGKIYDQFSILANGRRTHRLLTLDIDLSSPKFFQEDCTKWIKNIPWQFHKRAKEWPLLFSGDTLDLLHKANRNALSSEERELALQLHAIAAQNYKSPFIKFLDYLLNIPKLAARPYQALLKLLLERACR